METINGSEIAKRKLFCGDDGDNVPAIYTWLAKTAKGEEKTVRITPAKYEKILKAINYPTLKDIMSSDDLYDQILEEIKVISKDEPTIDIRKRLDRQIKLVVLDRTVFPEKIVSDFEKTIGPAMDKKPINPQSCNMTSILEGTRYVDATGKYKSKGGEISIFKEIDKIKSKELF